jgi:predicted nucleic acid-binding protein
MADLVIDSSVVVKWYVPEPLALEAHQIRTAYQAGALTLWAPDLIYAEVGNIIWKKETQQGLAATDAQQVIAAFRAMPLIVTAAVDLLEEAYQLAVAHRRTVYDALYLALSSRQGCSFVTADERLVNAVVAALPQVVWLGNWTPP